MDTRILLRNVTSCPTAHLNDPVSILHLRLHRALNTSSCLMDLHQWRSHSLRTPILWLYHRHLPQKGLLISGNHSCTRLALVNSRRIICAQVSNQRYRRITYRHVCPSKQLLKPHGGRRVCQECHCLPDRWPSFSRKMVV